MGCAGTQTLTSKALGCVLRMQECGDKRARVISQRLCLSGITAETRVGGRKGYLLVVVAFLPAGMKCVRPWWRGGGGSFAHTYLHGGG